jgi:hypothetical protein
MDKLRLTTGLGQRCALPTLPTTLLLKRLFSLFSGEKQNDKKSLYEELIVHIDKEELGKLLGADPGFEVQNIEEVGKEYRFILGRKTDLNETAPTREERRSFL